MAVLAAARLGIFDKHRRFCIKKDSWEQLVEQTKGVAYTQHGTSRYPMVSVGGTKSKNMFGGKPETLVFRKNYLIALI